MTTSLRWSYTFTDDFDWLANDDLTLFSFRSAFFCFSNEERTKVKAKYPDYTVGQIAKELGERWKTCPNKSKFEALAAKEKERYEEVS